MHFKTKDVGEFINMSDYRREARAQLKGHWKEAILLMFIPALIVILISGAAIFVSSANLPDVSRLNANMETLQNIQQNSNVTTTRTFKFVPDLISQLFILNVSFSMLRFIRGIKEHFDWRQDLLYIFQAPLFWKILFVEVIKNILIFFWSLLLFIPGIIKSYSYSQASYIMYDQVMAGEDMSPLDAITASRKMMKGRKWDKFLLDFSFIGWYLLSIITLGLGMFVLQPYLTMTNMVFYENARLSDDKHSNEFLHEMYHRQDSDEIVGEDPDDFRDFEDY